MMPFLLLEPEPKARLRMNSDSLKRRLRAEELGKFPSSDVESGAASHDVELRSSCEVAGWREPPAVDVEGRRLGVDSPEEKVENPGSAGVEGGG